MKDAHVRNFVQHQSAAETALFKAKSNVVQSEKQSIHCTGLPPVQNAQFKGGEIVGLTARKFMEM